MAMAADYAALLYSLDEGVPRAVVRDGQPERVFRLLDLQLFLRDVDVLELAAVGFHSTCNNLQKFCLVGLEVIPRDIAELGVLPDLVWGSGAHGIAIDVDNGFLAHVNPDNGTILEVRKIAYLQPFDLQKPTVPLNKALTFAGERVLAQKHESIFQTDFTLSNNPNIIVFIYYIDS